MPNRPVLISAATQIEAFQRPRAPAPNTPDLSVASAPSNIEGLAAALRTTVAAIVLLVDEDSAIDGFPTETHILSSRFGGEPLEDGRTVTDHVVAEPAAIELTGIVSDLSGAQRPREAWTLIREFQKSRVPTRISTEWGSYDEMLLERAEAKPRGRGMEVTLKFREILRRRPAVYLPPLASPAIDRTIGVVDTFNIGVAAFFTQAIARQEPRIVNDTDPTASSILANIEDRGSDWRQAHIDINPFVTEALDESGVLERREFLERTGNYSFGSEWVVRQAAEDVYDRALTKGFDYENSLQLRYAVPQLVGAGHPPVSVMVSITLDRGTHTEREVELALRLEEDRTITIPQAPNPTRADTTPLAILEGRVFSASITARSRALANQ